MILKIRRGKKQALTPDQLRGAYIGRLDICEGYFIVLDICEGYFIVLKKTKN